MVWEYKIDIIDGLDLEEGRNELNALGRDSWELVSADRRTQTLAADAFGPEVKDTTFVVILKRPMRQ